MRSRSHKVEGTRAGPTRCLGRMMIGREGHDSYNNCFLSIVVPIQKKLYSRPNVLSVSYHFLEIAWTAAVKASSGRLAGKEIFFFQTWSQD
jgi:hypothetical protein